MLPYLLAGLFIFSYVSTRVFTVPVTIDEAWTLYSFVRHPVWDIITAKNPSTNNHVLNTLLTKLTTVFSEKEFFLRLPNLLSLILYIYGSYMLTQMLVKNRLLAFAMFAMLLTNFTLLDFFGLCRGYGLSIGLMMISIAYLVKIVKSNEYPPSRQVHIILLTAALAFYANIAVLHVMGAIFLLTIIVLLQRRKENVFRAMRLPLLYSGGIGILAGLKLWKQFEGGEIFYGGSINFIDDTLASMMPDYTGLFFYRAHHVWVMNIAVALLVLAVLVHVIFWRGCKKEWYLFIPFVILVFCIVMTHVQFYMLGVLLPIGRIALYFYPLMVLTIFVAVQMLSDYAKWPALALGVALSLFSMWRFGAEMNISFQWLWWSDMYSKQVVTDIIANHKDATKARVFAAWPMDNSVNYYIEVYHNDKVQLSPCCTKPPDLQTIDSFDYLYLPDHADISQWPALEKVTSYHANALILYRNTGAQ